MYHRYQLALPLVHVAFFCVCSFLLATRSYGSLRESQLSLAMMKIVEAPQEKKNAFRGWYRDLGPSNDEADVHQIAPIRHSRSSWDLERGAWTRQNTQKHHPSLRLRTTIVEREAFFVQNQTAKRKSKNRCDEKSKLRTSQTQSWTSQILDCLRIKAQTQTTTKKLFTRKLLVQPPSSFAGRERDVALGIYFVSIFTQLFRSLDILADVQRSLHCFYMRRPDCRVPAIKDAVMTCLGGCTWCLWTQQKSLTKSFSSFLNNDTVNV